MHISAGGWILDELRDLSFFDEIDSKERVSER